MKLRVKKMRHRLRMRRIRRRQQRQWRRLPLSEYPLEYAGPSDMFITTGTPLAPASGPKAGQFAGRYVRPNGLEVHLAKKHVQKRTR